jgi:uncharacterized protein YecA (UPF0149 family)
MDTRDGTIYSAGAVLRMIKSGEMDSEDMRYVRPMVVPPTATQRAMAMVGRNDPCPCGSGQKFKRCCLASKGAKVR